MFALPISKPRFKNIIFLLIIIIYFKVALKWSYFCKKMQNFRALGAKPPDPQIRPPIASFWLRAWIYTSQNYVRPLKIRRITAALCL